MITIKEASLFCRDGDWIESKDQSSSGIRLIQTGNIGVGVYLDKFSRAKYISEETFNKLECTEVFPGDIIVSRLPAPVGRACIVPDGLGRTIASVDCTILRIDEKKFLKEYVLLYTEIGQYKSQIEKFLAGSTRVRISRKNLESISIPQKNLETQKSIVSRIYNIKNIIELRKQQLSKLDQLIKSRFIEMFGDPIRNEKNWPVVSLGEVAEIYIGPFGTLLHKEDYIYGSHALINPSHILEGKIYPDKSFTISEEKYIELKSYHLQKGDIVLGRRGEMGRCAVVESHGLICGTGSMIIRPYKKIKPYFIQNILSSPGYKKYIEDKAVGGTMLNLNVRIVSEIKIPLLPINMQEKFINFLHQIDNSKLTVKKSLEKLETLKKSLMQEYFG